MDANYLLDLTSRAINDHEQDAIDNLEALIGARLTFPSPEEIAERNLDAIGNRLERVDRAATVNSEAIEAIEHRQADDGRVIRKVQHDSAAALTSVSALDQVLDDAVDEARQAVAEAINKLNGPIVSEGSPIAKLGVKMDQLGHTVRGIVTEQEEAAERITGDGVAAGIEARLAGVEECIPPGGFPAEVKALEDELDHVRNLVVASNAERINEGVNIELRLRALETGNIAEEPHSKSPEDPVTVDGQGPE